MIGGSNSWGPLPVSLLSAWWTVFKRDGSPLYKRWNWGERLILLLPHTEMHLCPGKVRKMMEVVSPMYVPFSPLSAFPLIRRSDAIPQKPASLKTTLGLGVCFNHHLVWPDRFRRKCPPSGFIFKRLKKYFLYKRKGFLYFSKTVKNLTHLSSWSHFQFCLPGNHCGMGKTDCISSHDISVKCHHFSSQNDGVLPHIIKSYIENIFFLSCVCIAEKIKHNHLQNIWPQSKSVTPIQKWVKTYHGCQSPPLLGITRIGESSSMSQATFSSSIKGYDTDQSGVVST